MPAPFCTEVMSAIKTFLAEAQQAGVDPADALDRLNNGSLWDQAIAEASCVDARLEQASPLSLSAPQ